MSEEANNRLLVPMHLNALLVTGGESDVLWKDLRLDYNKALKIVQKGLDFYTETSIKDSPVKQPPHSPGIHLHWILPNAFRQGVQTEKDSAPKFPFAPNRWLIVRTFYPEANKNNPESRAWVVESDGIQEREEHFNWLSLSEDNKTLKPFALGKVNNLDNWSENKKNEGPFLTIMAPGNPTFAADYASSKDIFGFHDPLKEKGTEAPLPPGTCAYLVAGWYANEKAEILGDIKDPEQLKVKLEEFSWEIDEAVKDEIPNKILCHAFIHSISWTGNDQKLPSSIPEDNGVNIGIGHSTIEALGVLASEQFTVEQKSLQDGLLTILQYGLLSKFQSPDWGSILQEQYHDQGFHSKNGGSTWVIEKKEIYNTDENKGITAPDENKPGDNSSIIEPFPPELSKGLKELNEKQKEYDRELRQLKSLQLELYTVWYKNRSSKKGDKIRTDYKRLKEDLENLIKGCKERIDKLMHPDNKRKSLDTNVEAPEGFMQFKGSIPEKYQALRNKLDHPDHNKPDAKVQYKDYIIKETNMPVFFVPNDPAITLTGLNPSDIYDTQEELKCRVESQLANTINYVASILSDPIPVEYPFWKEGVLRNMDRNSEFVKLLGNLQNNDLPREIKSLYQEALLLDPGMAEIIAISANKAKGGPTNMVKPLVEDLKKKMGDAKMAIFKHGKNNAQLPPSVFLEKAHWKQPWLPLYLEWELSWASPSFEKSSFENWRFGESINNIDFILQEQPKEKAWKKGTYRGRIPINTHLEERIEDLLQSFPFLNDSFLKGLKPLAQAFDGLSDQLILRERGIQLPPLKYNKPEDLFSTIDHELLDVINDQYHYKPIQESEAFFPLRGGHFTVETLRIIDAFGQVMEITTEGFEKKVQVSSNVLREKKEDGKTYMQLPIRLQQPARLICSWMSAAEPDRLTDSDPGTSPVCGWLLPNYLDESLMIFDADGFSCGSLQLSGSPEDQETQLEWRDPPGVNREAEEPLSIKKGPLSELMEGLLKLPKGQAGGIFQDLVKMIYIMNNKIGPKVSRQHTTLPMPIGHPIAVVSASINLELAETPAQYKDIEELKKIDFPIRLGDMRKNSDGLLGYFSNQNYDKMFLAFANGYVMAGDNAYFEKQQKESVKMLDPSSTLRAGGLKNYTFLVDPRMDVQISSGILPTQTLSLPQNWIEDALQNIEISFLVNPLLTSKKETVLPLPDTKEKKWSWIGPSKEPGETWTELELSPKNNINLTFQPLHLTEGWIKMKNKKNS